MNKWTSANMAVAPAFALIRGCATLGVFFLAISGVLAQDLDAFRTAAASNGVNVIPFPDLRSTAASIASEVERAKTEATKYEFSLLERQKNNLLSEIKKTEEEIREKLGEIDEFESSHPDGDASPLDDDLEELEEALAEHREAVEDMNDDILEDAIEAWRRFWNARAGLREVFEDVVDELADARSSPEDYLGSEASAGDSRWAACSRMLASQKN